MTNRKKIFVLDTNVALHDSQCIYKFEEHHVIIPIQLIEEIDNFKKGVEDINFHAREFVRLIDTLCTNNPGQHVFNGGISLGQGLGKIRIALATDMHEKVKTNLRTLNVDAEIINLAFHLKEKHADTSVIIVSKDANLRVKAMSLGILAQDFLNDKIKDIDVLSREVKTIEVESSFISSFYRSDKPTSYEFEGARSNENFILKSDGKSATAIVKYRNGLLYQIQKDKIRALYLGPKNSEQAFAMDALLDPTISLVTIKGKAGTGKTIITLACAIQQLMDVIYDEILFSRQTISMGNREIGFLPGDTSEKISPYMNGMMDNLGVLRTINGAKNLAIINDLLENKKILIEPLSFIRGRSLHRTFLIIDESQNLTPHEVKTITTRAGEGTKIVFIGDIDQIDHPFLDKRSNGFSHLIQKFSGQECYSHIDLLKSERSALAALAGDLL